MASKYEMEQRVSTKSVQNPQHQDQSVDAVKKMNKLHHACKEGNLQDLIAALPSSDEPDSVEQAQNVPSSGLESKNFPYENTPLHLAVLFGHEDIVKHLAVEHPQRFQTLLSLQNAIYDTPVHIAARCGSLKMMEMMYETNEECIEFEGCLKQSPIHYACGFGHLDIVQYLLSKDKKKKLLEFQTIPLDIDPFERTSECSSAFETQQLLEEHEEAIKKQAKRTADYACDEQWTPLTYACHFGNKEVVHFLLSVGAKPYPVALQKAIEGGYQECARLLLLIDDPRRDNYWIKILNNTYTPVGECSPTTPFRELVKHMPNVAEVVLHNCVKMDRYFVNTPGFRLECCYDFVSNESESYSSPASMEHPISLMVKHKRNELLTHPVVACYIYDKWKSFGWWFSLLNLLLYSAFQVILFTLLIFLMQHPLGNCCVKDNEEFDVDNETLIINATTENGSCMENKNWIMGVAAFVLGHSFVRWILEIVQLVGSSVTALRKTIKDKYYQRCIGRIDYFKSWMNWIELPLYTLTLIFIISLLTQNFCLLEWQWQIGAFVMLLTWFELIVFFSQFQFVGVYALMFVKVLRTFVTVMTLAFLLIIAFALTFYMLLSHPGYKESPFMYAGRSVLKIMAMSTGELDSDSFFRYGDSSDITGLPFPGATVLLWIIFLILMTILLTNMLVGLAVGDITAVYKEAKFEKLSLEVTYILNIEKQLKLTRCCKCLLNQNKTKNIMPNAQKSRREDTSEWLISAFWGVLRYDSREGIERVIQYYSKKNKPTSVVELDELKATKDNYHEDKKVAQQDSKEPADTALPMDSRDKSEEQEKSLHPQEE